MDRKSALVDQFGRPVRRAELKQELAAPTFGGVRSPITNYPSQGLNPARLASLLREADHGDPVRFLELAEEIEEKDPHYLGVLGTRKRSVTQVEMTVEPGGEGQFDLDLAEMVRKWLDRDELKDELFDILDSIGKGYSFTEIMWDTSEGQWMPDKLEWRDPRWFRFARHDLTTPLMLNDSGQEVEFPGLKFIHARMKAKSGIPVRGGLARVACWGWMFKAFTQRDWAIFTQTYGQPLRVGKYGPGASEADRDKLFTAVANIAGDCAAIIPESMLIEFVESSNVGASTDHYERRSDWLDKQISKAVLGQTSTTDAEIGGLGSGKEHREVQKDIEVADCVALGAILNRDLIRPWVDLNHGPQKAYPHLKIAQPEEEDLKAFADAVTPFIDRGLRVGTAEVLAKFGLPEPDKSAEILRPGGNSTPQPPPASTGEDGIAPQSKFEYLFNGGFGGSGTDAALQAEHHSAALTAALGPAMDRLSEEAAAPMQDILEQIELMLQSSDSLEEFRETLISAYSDLNTEALTDVIANGLTAAHAGGRATLEEDSG